MTVQPNRSMVKYHKHGMRTAELWLDATKMHFFDEQSGEALTFAR